MIEGTRYFIESRDDHGPRVFRSEMVKVGDDEPREVIREVYLLPKNKGTFEPPLNEADGGMTMISRSENVRGGGTRNLYLAKGMKFARSEDDVRKVVNAAKGNRAANEQARRLRSPAEQAKATGDSIAAGLKDVLAPVLAQQGKRGGAA